MQISKKMKRFLCLVLVCLMLTPIISFATTDTNEGTTDNTDTTGATDVPDDGAEDPVTPQGVNWIDTLTSQVAASSEVDQNDILKEKEFLKLSESERKALSQAAAVVTTSKEDIQGHAYVGSNGGYELYLNKSKLSIIIRNEKTGSIIKSALTAEEAVARGYTQTMYDIVTSGIVVKPITYEDNASRFGQYTVGIQAGLQEDYLTYDDIIEDGKKVGFIAHVNFTNYGFKFDLLVKLTEEGALTWEIPESSMEENNVNYLISDLYVFPLLGYTDRGDRDGYMILPDGNGIAINYEDYFQDKKPKYKTAFSKRVYGVDEGIDVGREALASSGSNVENSRNFTSGAEEITVPYFGMVYTDTKIAMLGIVEKGEYGTYIEGYINGVSNCFENYTTGKYSYRAIFSEYTDNRGSTERKKTSQIKLIKDLKVTYLLASEEEASYSGLANKLRTHLLDNEILNVSDDQEFDIRLDFLGIDKENFLVFRRNVVATTANDIRDILGSLSDLGVTNVLAVYEGWQDDGIYNIPIYEFSADSDIGGNKEIKKLYKDLEEGGNVKFYLMQDMVSINTSMTSSVFTSMNAFTGLTYERTDRYSEVFETFRYLFPAKTEEYINDLVDDFIKNDINSIGLSGMSDTLFVYTQEKKEYNRYDSMKYYENALQSAKESGMDIVLNSPFMYLWKYTDVYLDLSVGSSMYVYASKEIPFLSSVLKGTMKMYSEYINFEANRTENFLRLVETGVLPSFIITKESPAVLQYTNSNWDYSSEYEKYEETIAEYYKELKAINDLVEGENIVNHDKSDSGVSITTYSNGVKVYVNFSDEEVTVDGITIQALSYKVGER